MADNDSKVPLQTEPVETEVSSEEEKTDLNSSTETEPVEPDKEAVTEPIEPPVDPMENLFDSELTGKKSNLKGVQHFEQASNKKYEELNEGLKAGDNDALLKFKNLKPKLQQAVVDKLADEITLEGTDLTSAKQLLDFYEDTISEAEVTVSSGTKASDEKSITSSLRADFMEKALNDGIKFDDLKKNPEYNLVVTEAKKVIAKLTADKVPLKKFDDYFDFQATYLKATHQLQMEQAHQKGFEQKELIKNAKNSSPNKNADLKGGSEKTPDKKLAMSDYQKLTADERDIYRKTYFNKHTKEVIFANS